jgi:hypothetical protein
MDATFCPKLYTGAIDKQGINIPFLDGKTTTNGEYMLEVLQTTKQELMPY